MKKFLVLLLTVILLASFSVFNTSAASNDIYVKNEATGDGSSVDKPFGTYEEAIEAAAKMTGDVTIHIVDNVTLSLVVTYDEPTHENTVTVTGGTIEITNGDSTLWGLGGKTIFKNVTFSLVSKLNMRTNFNDVTFDEGIQVKSDKGYNIGLRSTSKDVIDGYDILTGAFKANPTVTLKSGSFEDVCCFQNGAPANLDGKFTVNVLGDVSIKNLVVCRNAYLTVADAEFNLMAGKIVRFTGASDRSISAMNKSGFSGVTGTFTINVGAGFDLVNSFNEANTSDVFYGISGPSVYSDSASLLEKANYVLEIDAGIYDALNNANGEKVNFASFDKTEKTSFTPVITTTPTTTVAPATTAGGEETPATGDTSLFLLITASAMLCTAAAVLIKAKKN